MGALVEEVKQRIYKSLQSFPLIYPQTNRRINLNNNVDSKYIGPNPIEELGLFLFKDESFQ